MQKELLLHKNARFIWIVSSLLMKLTSLFVLIIFGNSLNAQTQGFEALIDSGEAEYNRQLQGPEGDFSKAKGLFEQALKLQPDNTTTRYFYGYTLDKLNSTDGSKMDSIQLTRTIKASEQFEFINKKEPKYNGPVLVLDPYSKITAIWGSQAHAYMSQGKRDSVLWALKEGKRRGGFLAPLLSYNRHVLGDCSKNAVLLTSGDDITFPILYLQQVEGFRTDVTAVDVNLLHSVWYPKYLKLKRAVQLTYTDADLDTLSYSKWTPITVTVTDTQNQKKIFFWTVKPTYRGEYFLKGDKVLLDLLKNTIFKREIYYSEPRPDSSINLSLGNHLFAIGITSKLIVDDNLHTLHSTTMKNLKKFHIPEEYQNNIRNSPSVTPVLNYYRYAYMVKIYELLNTNKKEAERLFLEMKTKFPVSLFAYDSNLKANVENLETMFN